MRSARGQGVRAQVKVGARCGWGRRRRGGKMVGGRNQERGKGGGRDRVRGVSHRKGLARLADGRHVDGRGAGGRRGADHEARGDRRGDGEPVKGTTRVRRSAWAQVGVACTGRKRSTAPWGTSRAVSRIGGQSPGSTRLGGDGRRSGVLARRRCRLRRPPRVLAHMVFGGGASESASRGRIPKVEVENLRTLTKTN